MEAVLIVVPNSARTKDRLPKGVGVNKAYLPRQPLYPPPKARAGIACALNDSFPNLSLSSHLLGSKDPSSRPAAPWSPSSSPCLTAASRQVALRLDSSTGAGMRLTCKFIKISEPLGTLCTSQCVIFVKPRGHDLPCSQEPRCLLDFCGVVLWPRQQGGRLLRRHHQDKVRRLGGSRRMKAHRDHGKPLEGQCAVRLEWQGWLP